MSGEATPVACTDTLATQLKTHKRKIIFSSRRETPFIANSASQDQVIKSVLFKNNYNKISSSDHTD